MKIWPLIIITLLPLALRAKTLYLDRFDSGNLLIKDNHTTSVTFEEDIKTIFLGDSGSFKADISGDKRILGLWSLGGGKETNLVVITDKNQYNFIVRAGTSSPLFYFIKLKSIVSKKEIIERSLIKDRDIIERVAAFKRQSAIKILYHDKEKYKDTLFLNIRLKIEYDGKIPFQILPDEIVLSQSGKVMPIIFKYFNKETKILTLTAEERSVGEKVRVLVPFKDLPDKEEPCVSEISI